MDTSLLTVFDAFHNISISIKIFNKMHPMKDLALFSELKIKKELKELIEENQFTTMTLVQQKTIPEFIKKDVIVQSQTGSGKTLSYIIPVLNSITEMASIQTTANHSSTEMAPIQTTASRSSDVPHSYIIHALIIVPTRELCIQIKDVINRFRIECEVLIGGTPIEDDWTKLNSNIIVGTPGRLFEIISCNSKPFSRIKYLVLDECDKLLGFGFEQKLIKILEFLPKSRITGLISATINDSITKLSQHSLKNPVTIKINENIPEKLKLKYMVIDPKAKIEHLPSLIKGKKCIVFFATCNSVEFFYQLCSKYFSLIDSPDNTKIDGMVIHKIHGKMNQSDRNVVYSEFERLGGTLFCTDVAARGIDFKNIDLVIHFDVPKEHTNIIHRSGRTARNGLSGDSIIFLMANEKPFIDFLKLKGIELEENRAVESTAPMSGIHEKLKRIISSSNMPGKTDNTLNNLIDARKDKTLIECAVQAFVSYIRSYKEHILNYILNYKELDYDGLAELYFLEKIPSMIELKNVKFRNFNRPVEDGKCKKRRINGRK